MARASKTPWADITKPQPRLPDKAVDRSARAPKLEGHLISRQDKLDSEDKAEILTLNANQMSAVFIAKHIGATVNVVRGFLKKYQSTKLVAKALFDSKAEELAERSIKHADVDQSLEILDRIDVLPKKRSEGGLGTFNIAIGMPGHAVATPSDAVVTKAIEAQSVEITDAEEPSRSSPAPADTAEAS